MPFYDTGTIAATAQTACPDLLTAALEYQRRGWSIIPVVGKRATGLWKPFQQRAADERTLRRLFARKGVTGLAVILGGVSGGLACRDFDTETAYRTWAEAHPDLAAVLPTVKTARGFHVYFLGPDGFHGLGDGEYRGDSGHYCVLPPSAHPDGPIYRWLNPLPAGGLPVIDPVSAGLLTHSLPQDTQADTQANTQANTIHTLHVSDEGIETAILASMPTAPGQRNHQLWVLARRLKGIIPGATIEALEVIVREWHARALPIIATKDWLTTWIDFRAAWAKVKRPVGTAMAEIIATARAGTSADADAIAQLVALCQAMQEHHRPGNAWPLSCRLAAEVIGMSHDTAARILKLLCSEGVIELVTPAGSKPSRIAAEYRFLEERK